MKELTDVQEKKIDNFFAAVNIEKSNYSKGGVWIFENGELKYSNDCSKEGFGKSVSLGKFNDAYIKQQDKTLEDGTTASVNCIFLNGTECPVVPKGICVYIYDTLTQSSVDYATFNFSNNSFSHSALINNSQQN